MAAFNTKCVVRETIEQRKIHFVVRATNSLNNARTHNKKTITKIKIDAAQQ